MTLLVDQSFKRDQIEFSIGGDKQVGSIAGQRAKRLHGTIVHSPRELLHVFTFRIAQSLTQAINGFVDRARLTEFLPLDLALIADNINNVAGIRIGLLIVGGLRIERTVDSKLN